MKLFRNVLLLVFACGAFLSAQHRVEPSQMYHRIYAVVPMTGKGTWADPKRPLLLPAPDTAAKPGDRSGILAFHHQVSDDGNFALVEIVAATSAALGPYTAQLKSQGSNGQGLQVFELGKVAPGEIESAFKSRKRDFNLEKFRLVVP